MATRSLFADLIFKIADENERRQALVLRSHIYGKELGNSGLDRFDESAHHLIGCDSTGRVISALRIVGPDQRPFDLEQLVDLSRLLIPSRCPAEVSRFCVDAEYRQIHRGQMVHLGMLKLLHEFSEHAGITDLFTLGLPHLKNLYRVGFFTALEIECDHPTWGPTQLLHLDLGAVRRRHEQSSSPIARLLFRTQLPNIII